MLNCACHSSSLLWSGYDILRESAVENKAPIKGIGIEARSAVGRVTELRGLLSGVRTVVWEKAEKVRNTVCTDGKRMEMKSSEPRKSLNREHERIARGEAREAYIGNHLCLFASLLSATVDR